MKGIIGYHLKPTYPMVGQGQVFGNFIARGKGGEASSMPKREGRRGAAQRSDPAGMELCPEFHGWSVGDANKNIGAPDAPARAAL